MRANFKGQEISMKTLTDIRHSGNKIKGEKKRRKSDQGNKRGGGRKAENKSKHQTLRVV